MINIPVEPPVTEYLHAKAARLGIPLSGTFELTPCCNMDCKMCYVRLSKQQQQDIAPLRTTREWLELGRKARDAGLLYLLLTGGEPFLRPDFQDIFQGLHRLGILLSINTNATLIDEKTIEWLKETPPSRVNITLYGTSDETYARLCGNPKGYTQVVKAIHLLKEAGISIRINCSLTPHNADDLWGIFDFAKREGLLIQATSYMFPPMRRDADMVGKNDRFTPEETAYYSAWINALQNGEDWFVERVERNELPPLPTDIDDCPDQGGQGEGIRCRAGKCSFWVTWNGGFLPCGMLPAEDAVNVFDVGFDSAWYRTKNAAAAIRLPAGCAGCAARDSCKSCAAMVYTETGNYATVPQYRCQMARVYPDACRRVADEIRTGRRDKR